ncbi:MAG: TraM recognition domain-containing protein [Candidatus Pacebacteria bacterium]|nr:TraM recognition domain-containing protein [Candidatus Paceibacterota bacterium]
MKEAFYEKLQKVPHFETPQEEIQFLRNELERHTDNHQEAIPAEKKREQIAESIIETYKEVPVREVVHESRHISEDEVEGITLNLSPDEHDHIIEDLYAMMMDKGIKNTLDIVMRMNNAHIEDDFHRFLVQYLASHYEVPGLKPKTDLAKSLGLRIYEILLPNKKTGEERDYKQTVTLMQQFMAGMQSIASDAKNKEKNFYTLELALAEGTDDMAMYVTVPKNRGDLFEKQLLGLFEEVKITEVYDDYNIFSYSGVVSASYGVASTHEVLQTKVYDDFDHDPMNVIVNAFSKLESAGEGAAIQFLIMPAGDDHIKKYGDVLDNLKKGKTIKEATGSSSIGEELGKGFGEFFNPKSKEKEESDKKLDEDAIASVTEKLNSTIVRTNIRLMASAATKQRSDDILHNLESAFQQFNNTKGNGITFKRPERSRLEDTVHEYIFRMFNKPHTFKLNLKELATMYHFPLEISELSQLKQESSKIAPAPSNTPKEGIILGKNVFRHRETMVHMTPKDRVRHFYAIGQTGTGKSHIFTQMIVQDIKNGDGVCFIDPHGTDIEEVLKYIPPERIDDVVYFDPAYTERPMGLNMLEYDPRYPEQKSFVINEMMSIFNKLFDMKAGGGAMFEQYFRNSAGLVMEHPESGNTLLEIGRVLADKSFRDMKLRYCTNPIIKQFWANAEQTTGEQGLENFVPYITSKFDSFISNEIMRPVVAQQKSSFNFRKIMDEKKILLVNLSKGRLGEINANLIGLVLVGKILMAALSRVDSLDQNLPPFYLYIDEFQNVSTDAISQILSEARKYGLGLHMAHQFIAQLDEGIKNAVFGNVGSMAVFRVSSEDAAFLEKRFLPQFSADDIMKIPNRNAYLQMLGNGSPLAPFNIATLALDQVARKNPPGIAEKIKQLSYFKYGKDRKEVEADIMRRYV